MAGLVVMRRANESFYIGDQIKITTLECRNGSVRFQIEAPKHIAIVREELVDDAAMKMKRRQSIENLKKSLEQAQQRLKVQGDESDIEDLGVRSVDPLGVADAYRE